MNNCQLSSRRNYFFYALAEIYKKFDKIVNHVFIKLGQNNKINKICII